jgi:hypothetical protein
MNNSMRLSTTALLFLGCLLAAGTAQSRLVASINVPDAMKESDVVVAGRLRDHHFDASGHTGGIPFSVDRVLKGFAEVGSVITISDAMRTNPTVNVPDPGTYAVLFLQSTGDGLSPIQNLQAFVPVAQLDGPDSQQPLRQIAGGLLKLLEAGCVNDVQSVGARIEQQQPSSPCMPIVGALGSLPAEYSHSTLRRILAGAYSSLARQWAAYVLVRDQNDVAGAPLLARAVLTAKSGFDRDILAWGFDGFVAPDVTPKQLNELVRILRPLTEHSDENVRRSAAMALRQNPSPAAIPVFVRLLRDKDGFTRSVAAMGLGPIANVKIPGNPGYSANERFYLAELSDWARAHGYNAD